MSNIEVGQDREKTPPILCPYCGDKLTIMIDGFKPDITKVNQANCPHCGGEIFTCLMIVTDVTMRGLLVSVEAIRQMFEEAKNKTMIITPSGN